MYLRTSLTTVAALVLTAALAACDDGSTARDGGSAGDSGPSGPTTLPSGSPAAVPDGYVAGSCLLVTDDRRLVVDVVVPADAVPHERVQPSHSCRFGSGQDGVPEISLVLLHGDPEADDDADVATLADLEAGFDERYGEEAVTDVVFERGVPVYGDTVGDRLTWRAEYESIPEIDLRVEADGLQVWLTAQGDDLDTADLEATFAAITASLRATTS